MQRKKNDLWGTGQMLVIAVVLFILAMGIALFLPGLPAGVNTTLIEVGLAALAFAAAGWFVKRRQSFKEDDERTVRVEATASAYAYWITSAFIFLMMGASLVGLLTVSVWDALIWTFFVMFCTKNVFKAQFEKTGDFE